MPNSNFLCATSCVFAVRWRSYSMSQPSPQYGSIMKTVIGVFIVAFIVGMSIGYKHGIDYVNQDNILEKHAFSSISVISFDESSSPSLTRSLALVIYHEEKQLYIFKLETDELLAGEAALEGEIKNPKPMWNSASGWAAIAAITGTVTLRELATKVDAKKKQSVIAAVVGGITGYGLGYKLATRRIPERNSPEIRAILEDPERWKKRKVTILKHQCLKLYRSAGNLKDQEQAAKYKDLAAYLFNLPDKQDNKVYLTLFRSAHGLQLQIRKQAEMEAVNVEETEETTILPSWLSWWWIGPLIGTGVLALAALVWWKRAADAREKIPVGDLARPGGREPPAEIVPNGSAHPQLPPPV